MKRTVRLSKWAGAFATLFVCGQVSAQQKHALSASQAVEYANLNSVQVKNALIAIQLQEQTNREITAMALPNITGSLDVNYYPKVAVQSFPNFIAAATYGVLTDEGVKDGNGNPIIAPGDFGFIQAQFGTKWNSTVGVSLSQILFDGQIFIGLQARKAAMDLAHKSAEVTEIQIKANVVKLYYQVIVAYKFIATIDANIERAEKLLADTREIFKNGFAEKLDVNKAEVTLANLRTERLRVDNNLQAGMAGLKLLMGMPVKDELVLTDTLSEATLRDDIMEVTYAYGDRKEFQQLELTQQLNEFNVRRYKLSKLPTLALFGNYSKMAQRNQFNFLNFQEPWFSSALIGIKLTVPIYEGGAKNARIKTAELQVQQIQNNMENLKLVIDNEVEVARINMRSALASMDFQKTNMVLAEEVYNQTKKKYEQGLGSNLEITNAQAELRIAQNNYYTALYDAVVAKVEFLRAAGKL
jgi:outer membrane protein